MTPQKEKREGKKNYFFVRFLVISITEMNIDIVKIITMLYLVWNSETTSGIPWGYGSTEPAVPSIP